MKYCIVKLYPNDTPQANNGVGYYIHQLLESMAKSYKHEIVSETAIDKETVLIISICTSSSISLLKRWRERYPQNKIVTGGQYTFHYGVCLLFSDYVNVGQGFEFFACKSFSEIEKLDCITFRGKKEQIIPSEKIEWELFPVAQTKIRHYYYMHSIGCRNKCTFCFTSWENRMQSNDTRRVEKVMRMVHEKKSSITLIPNEYDENYEVSVKDMMLKQYIRTRLIKGRRPKLIRLGIEFVTEVLRKKYGKPFTDEQFYFALDKAYEESKDLNLFFISGLSPLEDIENLLIKYQRMGTKPKIFVKLTNIVYTQFTPIWLKRNEINVDYFTDSKYYDKLKTLLDDYGGWRFNILRTGNPQTALYQTALNHVLTFDDYEIARKILNEKDKYKSVEILKDSGMFENDFRKKIKMWYEDVPALTRVWEKHEAEEGTPFYSSKQ